MTSMGTGPGRTGDRVQTGVTRSAIVQVLRQATGPMTVQQLADKLGLHHSSVRFHLVRLVHAGLVSESQANHPGPGRPRLVYSEAIARSANAASGQDLLAGALADHLAHVSPSPEDFAIAAGVERGRQIASQPAHPGPASEDKAKAEIIAIMRDTGFEPEWDADGRRLWLRTCPFRPLADAQPAVACSVHLGLMRGALDALDAPIEAASLDAFPAPHPCVATFVQRGEAPVAQGPTVHLADSSASA